MIVKHALVVAIALRAVVSAFTGTIIIGSQDHCTCFFTNSMEIYTILREFLVWDSSNHLELPTDSSGIPWNIP